MWDVLSHPGGAHEKAFWTAVIGCRLIAGRALFAQGVRVNRDNKTVSISATESIEVQPEIGVVTLGYQNFGRTQDAVFEENAHAAEKIIKALLAAGVKKEAIETQTLQLGRTEEQIKQADTKQDMEPQFQAQQLWRIRVPVGEVQKVVDLAVAAGANDIQDVDWGVKDPDALDTKARRQSLEPEVWREKSLNRWEVRREISSLSRTTK